MGAFSGPGASGTTACTIATNGFINPFVAIVHAGVLQEGIKLGDMHVSDMKHIAGHKEFAQ
jgi:hypothetical protein